MRPGEAQQFPGLAQQVLLLLQGGFQVPHQLLMRQAPLCRHRLEQLAVSGGQQDRFAARLARAPPIAACISLGSGFKTTQACSSVKDMRLHFIMDDVLCEEGQWLA